MDSSNIPSSSADNADWGKYIPLHKAILRADWEKAYEIISKDEDALTTEIDDGGETALHVAVGVAVVSSESMLFVENLLKYINPESLVTLVDNRKFNSLHYAARYGNTAAAKMLVDINPHLLFCFDQEKALPIHKAVHNSQKTTFIYLLKACNQHIGLSKQHGYPSPFEGATGVQLLTNVILIGYLDLAYELLKDYPSLAGTRERTYTTPLACIAGKWDAYRSGKRYNFYQRFIYSYVPMKNNLRGTQGIEDIENLDACEAQVANKHKSSYLYSAFQRIYGTFWEVALLHVSHVKNLQQDKVNHNNALWILKCICQEVSKINKGSEVLKHYEHAFVTAVQNDTYEVVKEIIEHFPRAIWVRDHGYDVLHVAITNRCERVYNFFVQEVIHGVSKHKVSRDKQHNDLLHFAGKLAPIHKLNQVSGAALQMQRELQWFEEVKKSSRTIDIERKNIMNETPMMVFRKEHMSLRKDGEEWMKKTADACTITAALIITIVFAAAITVPGGDDNGKPIYASKPSFIIFAVSDAISLFSSTTSLLLFLSVLTARYRDEDFLYSLPKKLILGLATLFLSVTSMMVAFSATLYIMFGHGKAWIVIPIATLTCLPIASFVTLQLPLLVDLIKSTYGNEMFAKSSDSRSK